MKRLTSLLAGMIILTLITGCSNWLLTDEEKIEMDSSAYMYNQDMNISKKVKVILSGTFNNKSKSFEGSLRIEDISFSKILFTSGIGLISYDGTERTILGNIYYDHEAQSYTIELSAKELLNKLTNSQYEGSTLIISSPADGLEDAVEIDRNLKDTFYK